MWGLKNQLGEVERLFSIGMNLGDMRNEERITIIEMLLDLEDNLDDSLKNVGEEEGDQWLFSLGILQALGLGWEKKGERTNKK